MKKIGIGVDIGSSGCKAVVVDKNLDIITSCAVRYEGTICNTGKLGAYEQPTEVLKDAVIQCLKKLVKKFSKDCIVKSIGLTAQMHGLVAVGEMGEPLRPMISCVDFRNEEQNEKLYKAVGGKEELLKYTNNKMLPSCTGGKILWLKEEEPEVFKRIKCILNPKDYIRLVLTGDYATDESDASGFGLYDVKRHQWNRELLNICKIPIKILPRVLPSSKVAGRILPAIANEVGLTDDVTVIAGGGDAIMQTVGTGAVEKGIYSIILGTGGLISTSLNECRYNQDGDLQIYCSGISNQWVAYAGLMSVGSAVDWFKNQLYQSELKENASSVYKIMEKEANTVPPGAEGLLFYPMLMGQRNPIDDPFAKGILFGLSPEHERRHMYRALLEGLSLGMYQVSEQLAKVCGSVEKIRISGGGAASDMWCQILSDVFGKEVARVENYKVCGALSSAVMGMMQTESTTLLKQTFRAMPVDRMFYPNENHTKRYRTLYELYKQIYPASRDLYKGLKQFETQEVER